MLIVAHFLTYFYVYFVISTYNEVKLFCSTNGSCGTKIGAKNVVQKGNVAQFK